MTEITATDALALDPRISGLALLAMALFSAAVLSVRLTSRLPSRHRHILNIATLALLSHAIWWVPHLAQDSTMARPVGPFLATLSQLAAVVLFDAAYRSERRARQPNPPRGQHFIAHLSGAAALVLTIAIGNLSLGFPRHWTFDPLAVALVLPVPLVLALLTGLIARRGWISNVGITAVGVALMVASVQSGAGLLSVGSPPVPWSIDPLGAWLLAVVSTVVPCVLLMALFFWKAQLRFAANLRSAIEALPVGLALYDAEDRLLVWNQALGALSSDPEHDLKVGMTYREALAAGLKSALFPAGARYDADWLDRREAQHGPGDWILQSQDGSRWVRLQNRQIEDRGLVTIASDFTDQKKHEAELAAALQDARAASVAKSRFLANMSHEIRTPLNGMVAVTDALSRTELDPKQAEMVALIRSSSDTLQVLLGDILDLARIESGQMKITRAPFDLVQLVHETQSLYANAADEKGVRFTCHISPEARSWVMGDAVRTRQILNNLLSNAVKFTSEGHIALTVSRRNDQLLLRVDDTGIGFDPVNLQYLFGRFAQADDQITRRYGGSGLGLSICAELADMMGGTVSGTSQPGLGSSFTVNLPMEPITAPNPEITPRPAANLPSASPVSKDAALRVLLADDNATNRRVVQLILDPKSFDLVEVENGKEAVDLLDRESFDLVLMDMQMPVMDGLTATRLIREREGAKGRARVPLIMLTANAMPEHVTASLEAGADAHLAKPFNVTQMLELTYNLTTGNTQPA